MLKFQLQRKGFAIDYKDQSAINYNVTSADSSKTQPSFNDVEIVVMEIVKVKEIYELGFSQRNPHLCSMDGDSVEWKCPFNFRPWSFS
jgi:hypothetical protein